MITSRRGSSRLGGLAAGFEIGPGTVHLKRAADQVPGCDPSMVPTRHRFSDGHRRPRGRSRMPWRSVAALIGAGDRCSCYRENVHRKSTICPGLGLVSNRCLTYNCSASTETRAQLAPRLTVRFPFPPRTVSIFNATYPVRFVTAWHHRLTAEWTSGRSFSTVRGRTRTGTAAVRDRPGESRWQKGAKPRRYGTIQH